MRVEGYELDRTEADATKVHDAFAKKAFTPAGDVVVEYARKDEGATATTYAWQPTTGDVSYVAMTLAPLERINRPNPERQPNSCLIASSPMSAAFCGA